MTRIAVFKPGNYPQGKWSPEEVQQLADDYDPGLLKTPLSVDHDWGGLSLGWVSALEFDGTFLWATLTDIHEWLYGSVQRKEYHRISVEIKPVLQETGRPYLEVVSFLGLATPQVKGLPPPQFAEREKRSFGDTSIYVMSCGDCSRSCADDGVGDDTEEKGSDGYMSKIGDALKKVFGQEVDQLDEDQLLERFTGAAAGPKVTGNPPSVSTNVQPAQSAADAASFAEKDSEIAKLKQELAESSAATRSVDIKAFCDNLMREGKVTPAMKELGLEKFMLSLSDETEAAQKFAETAKEGSTPLAFFQAFLETLPEQVEFKEVAPPGEDLPDTDEHEFMQVSRQFAEDKDCSMTKAISATIKSKPDLYAEFLEHQASLVG